MLRQTRVFHSTDARFVVENRTESLLVLSMKTTATARSSPSEDDRTEQAQPSSGKPIAGA